MLPDRTYHALLGSTYIRFRSRKQCQSKAKNGGNTVSGFVSGVCFHVIAAPRPSGWPDLDKPGTTAEGRFFLLREVLPPGRTDGHMKISDGVTG